MRFEHWIYTVRLVASLLYGLMTPNDPLTIAAATILLVVAAALASLIPARRAAMVDPIVALRYE
jgi:ABC-type lipoprotein release transport system permease subunit